MIFGRYNYVVYSGLSVIILLIGCTVSYKFEGGSINYDLTKTIHISDFPNRTSYSPTLSQVFNIALRKRFIEQTRLKEVTSNADIELDGEIVGFNLQGMAVKEDAYSSTTRLTINVRVHYVNNKESGKDLERTFSAFKEFDSSTFSDAVQDQLAKEIVDEIVDMIYNETVANW
ncbi:MAG: LPS assembly lipoprotein LptE [Dysgonamonadaceae bacterium]|jgi:hypothetical protein|nr:LPS assembly lipoprotein LptE [Dysgonamonadaceae bacterium]